MKLSSKGHRWRKSPLLRLCTAIFLVNAVLIGVVFESSPVSATAPSISLTPSSQTVAPGSTVDLTAGMPIAVAGTTSQEIVQQIDPTKVKLTGASDITAPAGWTLSYCSGASTDCTVVANFSATAPSNAAGWAAVKAVKATGTIVSDGEDAGRQVAIAQATGTALNTTPATVTASGSGDGFQSFFDPGRTRVFNVYHHLGVGANLDCHVIATGATCTGFPFNFGGGTESTAYGTVIGTRIWLPAGTGTYSPSSKFGMRCVDIAAVIASGAAPQLCATPFVQLGPENTFPSFFTGGSTSGLTSETKLYALDSMATTPKIYCLDTALAAPCTESPISLGVPQVYQFLDDRSNILKTDDRIYVSMYDRNPSTTLWQTNLLCKLASTGGDCPGWNGPKNQQGTDRRWGRFYELPDANGGVRGVCITAENLAADECWDAAGSQFAAATYNMPRFSSFGAFGGYGSPVRVGTRLYMSNASWNSTPGEIICFDAKANAGAGGRCNGETSATIYPWLNYTVTPDPIIDNCLWLTGHSPLIKTYNLLTKTEGCGALGSTQVKFAAPGAVPRMGCSATSSIAGWRSFTLDTPTSGFTAATLTIRDSGGSAITNWTARQVTAGTPLDLSSLTVSATGQNPSFVIDLAGATGSLAASARVKAIGDSPQLCLRPTAILTCPSGSGPISGLTASSMTVSASGSATDSSSNVMALTPASSTITISAPSGSQCGATLTGTATLSGTSNPAAGATVTLLDASGNPVLVNGSPVTTTTDSSGNYSFGYLLPYTYKVRFSDSGALSVGSTAVVSGGSGANQRLSSCPGGGTTAAIQTGMKAVTGATVLDRTASANLVQNGDFTNTATGFPASGLSFFYTHGTPGSSKTINNKTGTVGSISNWTATGGTDLTYAFWANATGSSVPIATVITDTSGGNNVNHVYFGNSSGATISPSPTFTAQGFSAASYTVTPASGYGTPSTPPAITQNNLPTIAGRTYRLQFVQGYENWGSGSGIAAFDLTGYPTTYFEVTRTARRITVEFLATSSSTTLTFKSWGHVSGGTELVLDDVIINQCASDSSLDSMVATVAVGSNVVVNASYSTLAVAASDTSSGPQGAVQTIDVRANDTAGTGNNLTSPTIRFCSVDTPPSGCTLTTKTMSGEGVYTLSGSNVVFTPCSAANTPAGASCTGAFTGPATSVAYQITDSGGQNATSTITPTVVPPPTASPDAQTGAFDVNQTYTPASNDTAGAGTSMVSTSVRLCPTNATAPYTATNCNATTLVTADGVYAVATSTGTVTFDPANTFIGAATVSVRYVVADALGQYASSTITPTVTPPAAAIANANTTTGVVGAAQSVNLLTNDTAPTGVTLTASSTRLCASGVNTPNCVSTTVDVPNVGTYTLSGGTVTFTPCTTAVTANCSTGTAFTGTPTALSYQVTDSLGRVVSSTYTPTVVPPPIASNDGGQSVQGQPLTITLVSNDAPGNAVAPLDPTTIRLCDPTETAPNCNQSTVTVNGQGTYSLNPDGTVRFTPDPAFTGNATPLPYVIADSLGQRTNATITPRIVPPPAPLTSDDSVIGPMDLSMTIDPLANDSAGTIPAGQSGTVKLVRSSLRLCDRSEIAPNCTATQLTTADGTYSVDSASGFVTFMPRQGFIGTVTQPVTYQVSNDWNGPSGPGTTTAVIAPVVDPAAPPVPAPPVPAPPVPAPALNGKSTSSGNGDGSSLLPKTGKDLFVTALWGAVLIGTGSLLGGLHRRARRSN